MWLLPSLNRPERLTKCLRTINAVGCATDGLIVLGPDQQRDLSAISAEAPLPWQTVCQHADDRSLVDIMNRFVRERPDLPWYGFLQDDIKIITPHWDLKLIQAAGRAGMASSNDLWKAPRRMTSATAYGGDLIRAFGFWCPVGLQHCYQDDFWEDVGRKCGNWKVMMDVRAEHIHYLNKKAPMDGTYKFAYDPKDADKKVWLQYRDSQDYVALLERVKAL